MDRKRNATLNSGGYSTPLNAENKRAILSPTLRVQVLSTAREEMTLGLDALPERIASRLRWPGLDSRLVSTLGLVAWVAQSARVELDGSTPAAKWAEADIWSEIAETVERKPARMETGRSMRLERTA